jgi:hypothetical protein
MYFQQRGYKIIQPPGQEAVCLKKAAYLPSKVKTATPSARSPIMMLGMARPNAERPYRRKNSIKHQAEIELGIFILHSP